MDFHFDSRIRIRIRSGSGLESGSAQNIMSDTGKQHPNDHAEAQVMLGFAEPVDLEHGPLRAEDFCSKIGGLPLWLNPEHLLDTKEMLCDHCHKPMTFLLQAVRSQLGQHTPYYTPVSKDDENAEKENEGWQPFPSSRHAKTCFVCGMLGPKICSKCHKVSYCGTEHQSIHWTKGLHKQLCGVNLPAPLISQGDGSFVNPTISSKAAKDRSEEEEDEEDIAEAETRKTSTQDLTKEQRDYANRVEIDYKLIERMTRFPELEVISEAEVFSQEAIEDGLADDSSGDEQEAEEGWEEKAAALKARKEKRASLLSKKSGDNVSNSLKPAESSMNALVPVGDEVYENTKTDIDAVFLTFQKRIALYPDQILRYARMEYERANPEPLYVSDIGVPKAEDIPLCPDCGRERTFEFQILPQLLNHLGIDHSATDALDFGTVLIFSCKDNCHMGGKYYQHEIALVQHFSEDGMQGRNMTSGPIVSVSSK
ncbi:Programmed cell death protein 2 [Modicella reniformis]|uniref:Programmed cell death protein 2 n=1 Tax=Modicella reniformis TaxID=1440133 RepID=A0A9P6J5U5_9FUNG|nr:Programmed cell death protein 2 [Modicella reniformis]